MQDSLPVPRSRRAGEVTVYILAGGQGTRLRPVLGDRVPKLLAPLDGKRYLDHLLIWLAQGGFRRVFFGLGCLAEPIVAALKEYTGEMEIGCRVEERPMGTAGALRFALQQGDLSVGQPLLVMNGDSMVQVALQSFLDKHAEQGGQASLLCVKVEDCSRFGRIQQDDKGRIVRFLEKDPGWKQPGIISAGTYLFEPPMLSHLLASHGPSLERDVFMQPLPFALHGVVFDVPFIDFGTPESFVQAQTFFRRLLVT